MFQARLPQGNLLKKLIDSIKDLVTEANFDVSEAGIQLQAMDTSHVCLLALLLRSDGFEEFRCGVGLRVQQHHKQQHGESICLTRHLINVEVLCVPTAPACRCDRNLTLGIPVASLQKLLKCAGNNDIITLKAEDSGEMLTLMFEDPKADRVSGVCLCVCVWVSVSESVCGGLGVCVCVCVSLGGGAAEATSVQFSVHRPRMQHVAIPMWDRLTSAVMCLPRSADNPLRVSTCSATLSSLVCRLQLEADGH